jgi:hypothetical protein
MQGFEGKCKAWPTPDKNLYVKELRVSVTHDLLLTRICM